MVEPPPSARGALPRGHPSCCAYHGLLGRGGVAAVVPQRRGRAACAITSAVPLLLLRWQMMSPASAEPAPIRDADLEYASVLLRTCGHQLQQQAELVRSSLGPLSPCSWCLALAALMRGPGIAVQSKAMRLVRRWATDRALGTRVRFVLQDVLDLRANNVHDRLRASPSAEGAASHCAAPSCPCSGWPAAPW
jgi:hypothetical protein